MCSCNKREVTVTIDHGRLKVAGIVWDATIEWSPMVGHIDTVLSDGQVRHSYKSRNSTIGEVLLEILAIK